MEQCEDVLDPIPMVTTCDGWLCIREGFKEHESGSKTWSLYSRLISPEEIWVDGDLTFERNGPGGRMRYRIEIDIDRTKRPDLDTIEGFCFSPESWSLILYTSRLVWHNSPKVAPIYARAELLPAGDANGDGVVDGYDVGIVLDGWGAGGVGDLNLDGIVDGSDLGLVLNTWGM